MNEVRGRRFERHASVGSTNAVARQRARDGDRGGLWVVAERQTEGRGRRGRHWASEPGNLYASHLSIETLEETRLGLMPLAAALALRDALAGCGVALARLRLKWPNDVLLDGAKIAGILLEADRLADGRTAVVAGFGVNCAWRPADHEALYPIASLAELGLAVTPADLLPTLDAAWTGWLGRLRASDTAAVRDAWRAAAVGIGEPITVRFDTGEISGRFVGLDADGRLILERSDGRRTPIAAGDVFFAAPPTAAPAPPQTAPGDPLADTAARLDPASAPATGAGLTSNANLSNAAVTTGAGDAR